MGVVHQQVTTFQEVKPNSFSQVIFETVAQLSTQPTPSIYGIFTFLTDIFIDSFLKRLTKMSFFTNYSYESD